MNTNRVNPPGSTFSAVVNGKQTGLAGCATCGQCDRARDCLRADPGLTYRVPFIPGTCAMFIQRGVT